MTLSGTNRQLIAATSLVLLMTAASCQRESVAQPASNATPPPNELWITQKQLQESGIVIKAGHARARLFAARDGAEREKPQADIQRSRRILQQPRELQFGGAQRRIGHVVDQPDMDGGAIVAIAQQELLNPAHRATAVATESASKQACSVSSRMKVLKVRRDRI